MLSMGRHILIFLVVTFMVVAATAQLAPVYKRDSNTRSPKGPSITTNIKEDLQTSVAYVTKTVYGFLDFVTTVSNTVMIFTPQSAIKKPEEKTAEVIQSTDVPTVTASRFVEGQTNQASTPTSISPNAALSIENLFTVHQNKNENSNNKVNLKHPALLKRNLSEAQKQRLRKLQSERGKTRAGVPQRKSIKSRPDLNYFNDRNRERESNLNLGGSTIVPITVEGTGKRQMQPTVLLESSFSAPPEVTVTASQGFATLSVIDSFNTAMQNNIELQDDYIDSEQIFESDSEYDLYTVEPTAILKDMIKSNSELPTGLVTTLGGTIISDGLTTVHETNVIGTFIGSKYAQILQSTSRIFQVTPVPSDNLNSPSLGYETVKSIIEGSATQFITPDSASLLPLESLFSESEGRARSVRLEESKISKRRGPDFQRPEYRPLDAYADEGDEYDLQRSGTDLRPSFRQVSSKRQFAAYDIHPTTYRRGIQPTSRRPTRPTTYRPDSFKPNNDRIPKPTNRWRLPSSEKPKVKINRNTPPAFLKQNKPEIEDIVEFTDEDEITEVTPTLKENEEETIRVETNYFEDGSSDIWQETATIRSLHTFRVGTTENTRFVTFTKTFTKSIEPTGALSLLNSIDPLYETPLFENVLHEPNEITTLPPIDISEGDVTALLSTITDTFSTTETMFKTSVLPIVQGGETAHYSLTQTYYITRVVTAVKTIPPVEAFSFIPENSLNEFNDKLLAEGTENEAALLPGELEYKENGEVRVKPPPGFKLPGPALSDLAGGKFNPDALEKQMHPDFVAALQNRQQASFAKPELSGTQPVIQSAPAFPTPSLTPEQLQQLAYIRLMNPYAAAAFGGLPQFPQPQISLSSSPVVFSTTVTTTTTRVLRVIFNARPLLTTITNTEVVSTIMTTYNTQSVTLPAGGLSPFGGYHFPLSFGAG